MEKRPFEAYRGDDPYIFVSYAHADSETVYPLLISLRERGVNIWYDEGIEPGSKWREELSSAIEHADKVLFVVSKKSAASVNCEREIDYALSLTVPVQVVYIENVELPSALSFSLGSHQAITKSHYDDDAFQQKVYDVITKGDEKLLGVIKKRRNKHSGLWVLAAALILAPALIVLAIRSGPVETINAPSIEITPSVEEPIRIAIKPLENLSDANENDWMGEGVANLLRDQLSSSRYAVVLSPVSWSSINDTSDDETELISNARRIGIDYLVSGELLTANENLLAAVRVTNLRAGIDVMSQTYPDLTPKDLVQSTTRIALNIKQAMKIPREEELQTLSADFVAENIAAYEAYVNGLQHYNKFEYEEAEKNIKTALRISPDFHIARFHLADILNTTSRRNEAREVLAAIPADAMLDARERFYVDGYEKMLDGEYGEAIQVYNKLLAEFPYEIEAQQLLARAYFDSYQEKESVKVLKGLHIQEPENPHVLGALGYQLTSIGELDEAREVLSKYVDLYPDFPNAWELNGALDLRTGDVAAAKEDYQKALELDAAFTPAKIGLAKTQALAGERGEAAAGFTAIRDDETLPPRNRIDAAFDLAHITRAAETPENIESALAPVRDLISEEVVRGGLYWYVLAQAEADRGNREKAFEHLENGVRDTPQGGVPTRFLHLRGVLKASAGEPVDAETTELAQYRLPDDNPDRTEDKAIAHLNGLYALKQGNVKNATTELRNAVDQYGYEYGVYSIDLARA
ncbi:MAG: TIR domain-containing protein, partial [Marinicaulis sp.]|nr:TIR domain-containing protein [Marinicaulis sp.]